MTVSTVVMIADAGSIHTIRWANALAGRGIKVHLASLRPAAEGLAESIILHLAPWAAPAGYFLNAPWLRRVLRTVRPDLAHAHYASGYGTLAALAGWHPLVLSVWGSDVYEFPATSVLHRCLIRHNLKCADLLLSTSEVMARRTRQFTSSEVHVTPFGIDMNRFRPMTVQSVFRSADIVVGTVKSLAPKYGTEILVRAFALVKARQPGLPLKLLLVGGGPQEEEIRGLIDRLGLAADTVMTGPVTHERVPEFQNMLSVSVSVSTTDSESFGVAVLEACACERPVIVSSVGGLPEVVEDGVTGVIVPPSDPERTAAAIERLMLDQNLRARMGRSGRARVARLFEWEQCVDVMLCHYRRVVA